MVVEGVQKIPHIDTEVTGDLLDLAHGQRSRHGFIRTMEQGLGLVHDAYRCSVDPLMQRSAILVGA